MAAHILKRNELVRHTQPGWISRRLCWREKAKKKPISKGTIHIKDRIRQNLENLETRLVPARSQG